MKTYNPKQILRQFFIGSLLFSFLIGNFAFAKTITAKSAASFFLQTSIDTMKYSRDTAREKLTDPSFDTVIDKQISDIAATGATHVAIDTPYDLEFLPMLTRWLNAARKYKLKVWFRGNFSGWEGWFDYPKISQNKHLSLTEVFILNHTDLFEDGDIFTSCPECENGGPGDPRATQDVAGFRKFLIDEYRVMNQSFEKIHKKVTTNYFSMNGDVASLIMDKPTTASLGGIVTIDHYVKTGDDIVAKINQLAESSGGQIVLGEYGAPIPDIHGAMTDTQQTEWLTDALNKVILTHKVLAVNYWVSVGGSTALWNDDGSPSSAVAAITNFYKPHIVSGFVSNELGSPVKNAEITSFYQVLKTDGSGYFSMVSPGHTPISSLKIEAATYQSLEITPQNDNLLAVVLIKKHSSLIFRLLKWIRHLFYHPQ